MRVLISKGRHYGNFLGFRFHWALLACLRWSLGTLGLPWVPLDGHSASICHLWGSIGAPLGIIGGHFGGPFVIILGSHEVSWSVPSVRNHNICWSKQRNQEKQIFQKKRDIEFVCIFASPNGLSQYSFTILLSQNLKFLRYQTVPKKSILK